MKFTKYILITLIFFAGLTPLSLAQESDFSELVVADDVSPEARLAKKINLTKTALDKAIEKVNETLTKLNELSLEEESPESQLRVNFVSQTNEHLSFYQEKVNTLSSMTTLEEINNLIDQIITYREETYAPQAKDIFEYILVISYTPSVIETANTRLQTTNEDVEKLEKLELVIEGQFQEATNQAQTLLSQAQMFSDQAKEALLEKHLTPLVEVPTVEPEETSTTTPQVEEQATSTPQMNEETDQLEQVEEPTKPRELAEASLNTIKELYDLFLETGKNIEQALGIQEGS